MGIKASLPEGHIALSGAAGVNHEFSRPPAERILPEGHIAFAARVVPVDEELPSTKADPQSVTVVDDHNVFGRSAIEIDGWWPRGTNVNY